ncbi:MAG: type IV pilus secretin PilQ [Desulfotignum sp.]|nr:type IV pilus secretin PilQ [Desulfotignum sp.]
MAFFQRTTTIERILDRMLMLVLVLTFGAGCTPLRSEAPVSSGIMVQDAPPGRINHLRAVNVSILDDQILVHIKTDQKPIYTAIKQDFPLGVAVYLSDTGVTPDFVPSGVSADPIQSIRVEYTDQTETTARIDVLMNQDLPFDVLEEARGLQLVFYRPSPEKTGASVSGSEVELSQQKIIRPIVHAPSVGASFEQVTGIEFTPDESGFAEIQVTTTAPVPFDTAWQTDSQLNLFLYNARIPGHFQKPLLTRYAGTAVDRILPHSGSEEDMDARIEILIRKKVPYRVFQNENRIFLRFDPVGSEQPAAEVLTQPAMAHPLPSGLEWIKTAQTNQPKYSGEKIKLDFYDTDIKNVFRILRSVSGLNFAVDKDVQGKVTMSLEKPVPWDQLLDLVLKMNGLGKKMEGDVVRVATVKTLRQEEKDAQEAIAARKKALEQKKSLEPLVTEYIPINYSDAQTDIHPHIVSLLTPERGSISVDQRSNMVIVTDTQEKVDQIQEMIYRLDTVTPQIMIEAKIVEVTKEFSRNIGVNWNLTNDPAISSGFVNDLNVSVNNPFNDGVSSGDFSFFRLFGSSRLALNAKLAASEVQGDVRIVSSPRILTLDNKKAKIKQGMEYAYLERDDAGGSAVKFKDIDLLLEVTPHVTPDERISMRVFLTKNDIAGFTPTGVPNLTTNETETELLVNNNDTVVIGGIVKTTVNKEKNGLPFLTGIPFLGNMLLGTETKEDTRNELLIFLTPAIVQLEQKRNQPRSSD